MASRVLPVDVVVAGQPLADRSARPAGALAGRRRGRRRREGDAGRGRSTAEDAGRAKRRAPRQLRRREVAVGDVRVEGRRRGGVELLGLAVVVPVVVGLVVRLVVRRVVRVGVGVVVVVQVRVVAARGGAPEVGRGRPDRP